MLQYRLDEQGGPQPPKPPGWTEPIKPTDKQKEKEKEQDKEKQHNH